MSTRYTKEELEEYFFEALAMFNDVLESDITSENVVLDFFIPANGLAVWRETIADIMADSIMSEYATLRLEKAADEIQNC